MSNGKAMAVGLMSIAVLVQHCCWRCRVVDKVVGV
jgi:hypothetical protein